MAKDTNQVRNREDWLRLMADSMAPWFTEKGYTMPNIRMAIGFPSTGARGRRIGECWDATASEDGTFEILIRPDQSDPVEVAAILAHELCHAVVGIEAGHGPKFKKAAHAIGLEGPMRSTRAGEAFKQALAPILERLGPLPHARLAGMSGTGPKKQKTRLIKAHCETCGYTVRVTRLWIEAAGPPRCAIEDHGPMKIESPDEIMEPENQGS